MPDSLQAKLAAARKRWRSVLAAGGFAATFALLAALCIVSFHTDRLLALTSPGRLAWLLILCLAPLAAALALVFVPLRRPLADETVAAEVERAYPALNERLLSTIELARAGAGAGVSSAMISQLAGETERLAAPLDFVRAVPTDHVRKPAMYAGIAGVLLFGHVVLAPGAMGVWARRMLSPYADIPLYAHTRVWATPGDVVVARAQDVQIGVLTTGTLPDRAVLHYRFDGAPWAAASLKPERTTTMPAAAPGEEPQRQRTFAFRVADAQQSFTYYATAGDGQANPHTVRVEDRPAILGVRLRLDYPAYTGRPPDTVTATAGNINAPVGTKVEIEATASKPLSQVEMVENGKQRHDLPVHGETAAAHLTVMHDETYSLLLKDTHGFDALNPPQYTVRAQPDQTPQVQIVKPAVDVERAPGGSLDVKVTASDDYGVKEMRLSYDVGKHSGSLPLPGANGGRQAAAAGPWDLAPLNLKAGDVVTYLALARDGDNVSGPHTGRSASYHIRIIGAREMRERLDARKAEEREALRQLVERQKAAQADLQKARQSGKPDAANNIAQAEATQRSVAQEAGDLTRRVQDTSQQMRDNNMAPANEMKQRDAAAQRLGELAQKAMPAAADAIQRRQLPDAARQEQAIRSTLEQLAQETAPPADAFKLAAEADRLAQAQQRLSEQAAVKQAQMGNKPPSQMTAAERQALNNLAKQQASVQRQTAALQQQIQRSAQAAQERNQASAPDLQRAAQQLQQAGTQQKQAGAQQDLRQGMPDEASPKQSDAARDLQKLADNLDRAGQKQQSADAMGKRADDLEKLADRLQDLALKQRSVADQSQPGMDPQTAQNNARQEQALRNQAGDIGKQLQGAPQAQQGVQRAGQNMQQAQNRLEQNEGRQANSFARDATRQLLQAAMDARNAARNMRQSQEARQMQQAVEQLAADQRALEKQTQALDARRQRPNQTPEQQKAAQQQAQQLAQAQSGIQQRTDALKPNTPSQAFRWALDQAGQRMAGARRGLDQRNTGSDTQRQQENAAQTLEHIARALQQQADGAEQQQAQQQSGQEGGAEQEMAQAQGELQLSREMQAQIRQETASVDQRRRQNPGGRPTAEQDREIESLSQAQRETERIARRAAQQLRSSPQIAQTVQRAADQMDDVQERLRQRQTEGETQTRQDRIVQMLDQAIGQTRQAMRQQRQQMAQQQGQQQGQQRQQQMAQGQQGQQQGQQPGGNRPHQGFVPVMQAKQPNFHGINTAGQGFGALSPRAQQLLREGRQERVPAEYSDLVNQYYKALSERGK